jgi:hypothetical protein
MGEDLHIQIGKFRSLSFHNMWMNACFGTQLDLRHVDGSMLSMRLQLKVLLIETAFRYLLSRNDIPPNAL